MVSRKYSATQAGTAPKPMMIRHILSTAETQAYVVLQAAGVGAVSSPCLNPTVVMRSAMPAPNWPRPCMAKTELIIRPLHLVLANSEVIVALKG